ncbi:MAG: hypothetical protein GX117_02535, partial [Candidatus Hydrogenedentes bacterium]|nr:hypothetical protein [Candidatus Hydrogenedentota bacterium]
MGKFLVADWSKQVFAAAFLALLLLLTGAPGHAAVLRVNGASAAGAPNGSSWANAFKTIQSAVDAADTKDEIWVAQGTYTGTTDSVVDMSAKTLVLYGGFAGTETNRGERNWEDNHTIIDGEGERRCVTSNNAGFIDGFTLQNGKDSSGGGMYDGTAANCSFTKNSATWGGGGMSWGTATNCTFTNNSAKKLGGGMASGTETNCTFTGNSAEDDGGGMAGGTATNCTFTGNTAEDLGGGMSGGTATNCIL